VSLLNTPALRKGYINNEKKECGGDFSGEEKKRATLAAKRAQSIKLRKARSPRLRHRRERPKGKKNFGQKKDAISGSRAPERTPKTS